MRNQIVISIVAGAAAGFVGAGVAGLLAPSGPRGERAVVTAPLEQERTVRDDRELRGDLDDLRMLAEDLVLRVGGLEERTRVAGSGREAVAPAEVAATELGDDLVQLATALREGRTTQDFQVLVASALDEIRAQEEEAERLREHERMLERLEERLTDLTEELGLTPYQVKEMRPLLLAQEERRMELFRAMREGDGEIADPREEMRAIRDETMRGLATLLSPDQLERYEEQGWRGRDGRRDGRTRGEGEGG